MHTVATLSGDFGATYETLPGRLRRVNNLGRLLPTPPASHLVAGWVLNGNEPALSRLEDVRTANRRTALNVVASPNGSQIPSPTAPEHRPRMGTCLRQGIAGNVVTSWFSIRIVDSGRLPRLSFFLAFIAGFGLRALTIYVLPAAKAKQDLDEVNPVPLAERHDGAH
jgi:hypothetical protein